MWSMPLHKIERKKRTEFSVTHRITKEKKTTSATAMAQLFAKRNSRVLVSSSKKEFDRQKKTIRIREDFSVSILSLFFLSSEFRFVHFGNTPKIDNFLTGITDAIHCVCRFCVCVLFRSCFVEVVRCMCASVYFFFFFR